MREILLLLFMFFFATSVYAKRFSYVVIDPGHGGKDGGTHWYGVSEKNFVLDISRKLSHHLKYYNIKSIMTRKTDVFISLDKRVDIANRVKDSIFVSVHINANKKTKISGFETYYCSNESKKLALLVQKYIDKVSFMPNNGVIYKPEFKVIRQTKSPAVLCELGYISNPRENKLIRSNSYRNQLAKSLARAIAHYKLIR